MYLCFVSKLGFFIAVLHISGNDALLDMLFVDQGLLLEVTKSLQESETIRVMTISRSREIILFRIHYELTTFTCP